jgi:CubicO group peptidase (beta-lactamase class C family)
MIAMRPDSIASLRRTIACCATLLLVACSDGGPTGPGGGGTPVVVDVQFIVDSILAAYDLPALGGAIVTVDPAASRVAVAGARRVAGPQVTPQDLWHLGSNFKAFTGMLAAIAVDGGAIAWTTTVTDAFPELSGSVRAEYADVTLRELLSHRSGVPRDPAAGIIVGSTREQQRNGVAAWALAQPMASTRGTYSYTNTGYMIAAAMVERALGVTFEDAMAARVFAPLGITSAGWGPQAIAGSMNQPVAHTLVNGQWVARENFDNPPVYASAGGAHMSINAYHRRERNVMWVFQGLDFPPQIGPVLEQLALYIASVDAGYDDLAPHLQGVPIPVANGVALALAYVETAGLDVIATRVWSERERYLPAVTDPSLRALFDDWGRE